MLNPTDYFIHAHQSDLLMEADRYRLVQEALAANHVQPSFYQLLLAYFAEFPDDYRHVASNFLAEDLHPHLDEM